MMNTTNISTIPLPYHSYNVFFILERALIIHERNGMQQISGSSAHEFNGYGPLDLPPPPPRYRQLESVLAPNWYIPGIRKLAKRKHVKSHGVASFREISRIIAETWKTLELTTKQYVQDVSNILKARHAELIQEIQQQEIFRNQSGSNKSRTQTTTTLQMREQKQQHQPMPSPIGHWSNNVTKIIPEEQAAYPPVYCGDCYDPYDLNKHSSLFMPTTLTQHTTLLNNFRQGMYLFNDASGVIQRDAPPSESCNTTDQSIFCSECHH